MQAATEQPTNSAMKRLARMGLRKKSARQKPPSEDGFASEAQAFAAAAEGALYEIHIASGMHSGATIELPEGVYKIGDDITADIFLVDFNGSTTELRLEKGHAFIGGADEALEVLPRRVGVSGIDIEISGGPPPSALDTVDAFGAEQEADISEEAEKAPRKTSNARTAALPLVIGIGSLTALGAAVIAFVMPTSSAMSDSYPRYAADRQVSISSQASLADPNQGAVSKWVKSYAPGLVPVGLGADGFRFKGHLGDVEFQAFSEAFKSQFGSLRLDDSEIFTPSRIETDLRRRLGESDVGRVVDITWKTNDGGIPTLVAKGTLSPDRFLFWRDVQNWFESRFDGFAKLESSVTQTEADRGLPPKVDLEAVWTGADPYIVTADGRRTRQGEVLPSGWKIEKISQSELRLARGERVEAIILPGPSALDDNPKSMK
jgi:hypothetical protein